MSVIGLHIEDLRALRDVARSGDIRLSHIRVSLGDGSTVRVADILDELIDRREAMALAADQAEQRARSDERKILRVQLAAQIVAGLLVTKPNVGRDGAASDLATLATHIADALLMKVGLFRREGQL